jgi:hypothetical protein
VALIYSLKVVVSAVAAFLVAHILLQAVIMDSEALVDLALRVIIGAGGAIIAYLSIAWLLGIPDVRRVLRYPGNR